jgi:type I restriction enzyme, S subunit
MAITETLHIDFISSSLGTIPGDWEVKRLGDICKIFGRIGYRGYTINDIVEKGDGAITLSPSNFNNGYLDYSDCTYISWFKYDESPEIKITNDDILLVKTGSTYGKSALVNNLVQKATINPQIVVIKNVKSDVKYLTYIISDSIIQKQIKKVVVGGAIPTLSQENILNFILPLPPLHEQKAISQVLGLMDSAINTNNRLIAKKELQKKWLIQHLLSGKKRLRGFSGLWKEIHIKDVSKEVSIRNKADNQLTVLSCTKYDGLVPSLEYFGRKIFSDDVSTYKVVPKNHFAYATNHIEEGSIGYQDTLNEALISPMYTVFKTDSTINDIFFYKLLKSHKLVYQYQNRMEGSIDRRGGLRWDAFSIIKVQIPSYEEQSAIAKVLQIADKEIQLLKTKTEKLREQKKGLMQVLLTGKKRLIV